MKRKKTPLYISYQMGKVMSSSIVNSVDNCLQLHSWSNEEPIKYFSSRYTGSVMGRLFQNLNWKYKFWNAKNKFNNAIKKNIDIKIIIGVREPISRNISGYFQTLNINKNTNFSYEFHKRKFFTHTPHLSPIYWFDNELFENFNINIYKYNFDKKKGFQILNFKRKKISILLYKFENVNNLTEIFKKFLLNKDFKIKSKNKSQNKWYNKIYKKFVSKILFDKSYISLMYGNKYMNHFYSSKEISFFKKKWSRNKND